MQVVANDRLPPSVTTGRSGPEVSDVLIKLVAALISVAAAGHVCSSH